MPCSCLKNLVTTSFNVCMDDFLKKLAPMANGKTSIPLDDYITDFSVDTISKVFESLYHAQPEIKEAAQRTVLSWAARRARWHAECQPHYKTASSEILPFMLAICWLCGMWSTHESEWNMVSHFTSKVAIFSRAEGK